jgi:osmotically-inducible protein OsmY
MTLREKTFKNTAEDIDITFSILKTFSLEKLKIPGNSIDVMVNEKRVLLSGIVSDHKMVDKAEELAWQARNVKEVINEIQVAKNKSKLNGFKTYSKDASITSQIEAKVLLVKDVSTMNIKINTVNSVVYLLGVAKSNYEINKITKLAAKIAGVKKVISHIIEIDDDRRA